ncbi:MULTISPECIES: GOLPH3/VPS74 family protein [Asanoa]|uniref:GOLPH3/VPS74 family protein n=1 Tax=Asanoa TaxID=195964 RepID=UPI001180E5B4|nr:MULTISPECIES: GPP34 family phosphoprotein [Asanoa]
MSYNAVPCRNIAGSRWLDQSITEETLMAMRSRDLTFSGETYLIAHDDRTGKPRLHKRGIAVTLAAALLAELLYANRLHIQGRDVAPIDGPPPQDQLARDMWMHFWTERHPLRTWLEFFATTARDDVIARLKKEGVLVPGRRSGSWRPSDPNVGAQSWARLSVTLRRHERLNPFDACLLGLIHAAELQEIVLDGGRRSDRQYLESIVDNLWPPLADLLDETRSLIGAQAITHRM